MDKAKEVGRWLDAVRALHMAAQAVDRAGQGLDDSDILAVVDTREERDRLLVLIQETDDFAQVDTRRFTLPQIIWGANDLEDKRADSGKAAVDEANQILGHGDPCST